MSEEKIGIVAANNIRYSPYILFYTNILDECGASYELIYPNRNQIDEAWDGIAYPLEWNNRIHSILNYMLYTDKVIRIIKEKKYSKLIILTSVIAAYMANWLEKHYQGRFVVDIRDYTYENIKLYAYLEGKALRTAKYRVISSERFKCFLPQLEYHIAHNISVSKDYCSVKWEKHDIPIIIGYVGSVAYKRTIEALARLVKKDSRFCFYIYGGGPVQEEVKKIVTECACERVRYYGPYEPKDKPEIIGSIDILFNVYGNDSPLLLYALSNKLYDAMYYHKLVLNSIGTYMEEMCGICGYSIDLEKNGALKELYNWYKGIDEYQINEYQDRMSARFFKENSITHDAIVKFIREV